MRYLPFVLTILLVSLAAPGASQASLYVVGDGREVTLTDPNDEAGVWAMSTADPGADTSVFSVQGSWNVDSYDSPFLPTWKYDGTDGAVVLSGKNPVEVHAFVDHLLGGICARVFAQLFDADGNVIGPAGGVEAEDEGAFPSVDEVVFVFDGIAGRFNGLGVQVAPIGVDCGHADFYFGSSDYPAGIRLGAGDYVGSPATGGGGSGGSGGSGNTAETVYRDLDTADLNVFLSFPDSPSDNTFVYNWTSEQDELALVYNATVTAGSVRVVASVDGDVVLDEMIAEDTDVEDLLSDAAGAWNVRVELDGFQGTFGLTASSPEVEPSPTTTGTTTTTTTGTRTTGTGTGTTTDGNTTDGPDEDSPGAGFLAVGALLGVAVIALRRRL